MVGWGLGVESVSDREFGVGVRFVRLCGGVYPWKGCGVDSAGGGDCGRFRYLGVWGMARDGVFYLQGGLYRLCIL